MANPPLPKLVVLVGPTASGKTSLGIALADRFEGEVVSADSRQIYRDMDIGTAKALRDPAPDKNTAEYFSHGIPHHLIDIRNPDEDYSVADFKRDTEVAIDQILSRGHLPFLVGGTGLYIRAIVENLDIPEVAGDPAMRQEIENEIAARGLAAVFEKLVALDPEAAYVVDPKNPRRIVRALEVAMTTGKPFTAQRRHNEPRYAILELGLNPPPEILRERINQRIDQMMRDGLVDEVKKLLEHYDAKQVAFDAIGYREIIDVIEGRTTLDEAIAAMKMNTWHFARHQMTWFKKDKKIVWVADEDEAIRKTEQFLREFLR